MGSTIVAPAPPPNPHKGKIQLIRCPACGGNWFREATFFQFAPRLSARGESTCLSQMHQTILICLCGTLSVPEPGGIRGGRTPNLELSQFHASLSAATAVMPSREASQAVLQQCRKDPVRREQGRALEEVVEGLERDSGRVLARTDGRRKSRRGRYWQPPERQPTGSWRDRLAYELAKRGCTFDEARQLVTAILDSIKEALQRGESVETPLGDFRVVKRPAPQTRWRLGRVQRLFRQPQKVVFVPGPALLNGLSAAWAEGRKT